MKRFKNQPKGTQAVVHIEDIKIPPTISKSIPSKSKIEKYCKRIFALGRLDKPITVIAETNERNMPNKLILVDGYIRYILAKRFFMKEVPITYYSITN
jgi:hypothetical protein